MEYIVDDPEVLKKMMLEKASLAKYVSGKMIKKYQLKDEALLKFQRSYKYIFEFSRRFYCIFLELYLLAYYSNIDPSKKQQQANSVISTRELEKISLMSYTEFEDIEKNKLLHLELEFAQKSHSKDKYREVLYKAQTEISGIILCRIFHVLKQELPTEAEMNIDCTLASMQADLCKNAMGEYLFSLTLYTFKHYLETVVPLDDFLHKISQLEDRHNVSEQIFFISSVLPMCTQIDLVARRIVEHMYKKSIAS
ncbi:MAG: hypothetical protein V1893_03360 [Candidatus Omnitrophota bacterium]